MSDTRTYTFQCEVSPLSKEDGGGYVARFPFEPGVMSDGTTPEEALINGLDALKCALEALETWRGRPDIKEPRRLLGELLAVIHRDGGHYQGRHGTKKAVEDAQHAVIALRAENAHLDIYTCHKCAARQECEFAWDHYNTGGDCLAVK